MGHRPETAFDSIESTHQFVELLLEAIEEARREIDEDISEAVRNRVARRQEALLLIAHNLSQLSGHITKSRRILNDLRTLRRLLLKERQSVDSERSYYVAGAD